MSNKKMRPLAKRHLEQRLGDFEVKAKKKRSLNNLRTIPDEKDKHTARLTFIIGVPKEVNKTNVLTWPHSGVNLIRKLVLKKVQMSLKFLQFRLYYSTFIN